MRSKKVTLLGLLAATAMLFTAGCMDANLKSGVTVSGKIIDAVTKEGVGGAKVSLKVNGKWYSTTTSKNPKKEGFLSQGGNFSISGMPSVANGVAMVVEGGKKSTYVPAWTWKSWSLSGASHFQQDKSIDWGSMELHQGTTVSVKVVDADTGEAVTNGDETPLTIYASHDNGWTPPADVAGLFAMQNADDASQYDLTVPASQTTVTVVVRGADTDGDGMQEYTTGNVDFNIPDRTEGNTLKTIKVSRIVDPTAVGIAGYAGVETIEGMDMIAPGATPITVIFDRPVEVLNGDKAVLTYWNDMNKLAAGTTMQQIVDLNSILTEVALAVTTGSDGLTATFTPAAELQALHSYTPDFKSVAARSAWDTEGMNVKFVRPG